MFAYALMFFLLIAATAAYGIVGFVLILHTHTPEAWAHGILTGVVLAAGWAGLAFGITDEGIPQWAAIVAVAFSVGFLRSIKGASAAR